jgi:hypothetical protein
VYFSTPFEMGIRTYCVIAASPNEASRSEPPASQVSFSLKEFAEFIANRWCGTSFIIRSKYHPDASIVQQKWITIG